MGEGIMDFEECKSLRQYRLQEVINPDTIDIQS